MTYFRVVASNRGLIGFGLLTAFSTSFGQTFFISLFLPHFLASMSLDESGFGMLYAVATLSSALLLPKLGAAIDSSDLKRYTSLTVLALVVSAIFVATAQHAILLGIGIAGLRLTGQGLLGHISHTIMARSFRQGRGRALALASLGYPLGEALLPITFAGLLAILDWRTVWWVVALFGAMMTVPLRSLANGYGKRRELDSLANERDEHGSGMRHVLRDPRFYVLLPAVLLAPFLLTGMFLYQIPLATSRGWSSEWIAGAFVGFAVVRAISAVAVGPLIDRYSAAALMPVFLLPLGAGLLLLNASHSPWIAFAYLSLAGVTGGVCGSITSAVWAEMFGVARIGSIRSFTAGLAILSTAASPVLLGFLLQRGSTFDTIINFSCALIVAGSAIALPTAGWNIAPGRTFLSQSKPAD